VSINYKKISAPYWATSRLRKNKYSTTYKTIKKVKQKSQFEILLEKELKIFEKKVETKEEIEKLQEKLSDL
jgi:hypothetical protein